jgi:hypothetical protein
MPRFETDTSALAIARIEAHYFVHRAFNAPPIELACPGNILVA